MLLLDDCRLKSARLDKDSAASVRDLRFVDLHSLLGGIYLELLLSQGQTSQLH